MRRGFGPGAGKDVGATRMTRVPFEAQGKPAVVFAFHAKSFLRG
jgi:hypothetical protein